VVEDEYFADEDHAFSCFLAGLSELGYGFAYRTLDAQHFGVPQRRRRVFVVAHLGDWRRAAAVLFERHSLCGNFAPSHEKGEVSPADIRAGVAGSLGGGGDRGWANDLDRSGAFIPETPGPYWDGSDIADTLDTSNASKQQAMPEKRRFQAVVTHSLRGTGFDASEDGTGRGTPLVPVAIQERAIYENPEAGPDGAGFRTDGQAYTLEARSVPQAVAFAENQRGELRTSDVSMQLSCSGGKPGSGYPAVMTLAIRGRGDSYDLEYRQDGIANAILTPNGGRAGMGVGAVAIGWSEELTAHEDCAGTVQRGGQGGRHEGVMTPEMAVRRLTPVECERLQGFPDSWTKISDKTADGPRYKTIGNSMAVPCMNWIGRRIDEQIKRFSSA